MAYEDKYGGGVDKADPDVEDADVAHLLHALEEPGGQKQVTQDQSEGEVVKEPVTLELVQAEDNDRHQQETQHHQEGLGGQYRTVDPANPLFILTVDGDLPGGGHVKAIISQDLEVANEGQGKGHQSILLWPQDPGKVGEGDEG